MSYEVVYQLTRASYDIHSCTLSAIGSALPYLGAGQKAGKWRLSILYEVIENYWEIDTYKALVTRHLILTDRSRSTATVAIIRSLM